MRLRVFENRVLRGVFGWKRERITRKWRILRNEEPHHFSFLPTVIKEHEMGGEQ
jgi:hypothetical protein